MASELVARLDVLAAALLFSTGGAAIKACSLSSWQVASFRSAVACLIVLVLLPESRRRWSGRRWGCRHRWQRRDPDPVIGNGDAVTLQLIVAAGVLHDSDGWRREEHHTPIDPPPEVERRPGPGPVLKAPA